MQAALTGVRTTLARLKNKLPRNGLLIFASAEGVEAVEPPHPVPRFIYRCDARFRTELLEQTLEHEDMPWFAAVIVDGRSAIGALVRGGGADDSHTETRVVFKVSAMVPGRTRRGGQSAPRIGRLRDEAADTFAGMVADRMAEAWLDGDGRLAETVLGLVLAGPAAPKRQVQAALCAPLAAAVVAVVDTKHSDERGVTEAAAMTQAARAALQDKPSREGVGAFFAGIDAMGSDAAPGAGATVAFGPAHVAAALQAGAVAQLLVSEDAADAWAVREAEGGYIELRRIATIATAAAAPTAGPSADGASATTSAGAAGSAGGGRGKGKGKGKRKATAQPHAKARVKGGRATATTATPAPTSTTASSSASSSDEETKATASDGPTGKPLREWLRDSAVSSCGVDAVHVVKAVDAQTTDFCVGFGGLGAILRWPFYAPDDDVVAATAASATSRASAAKGGAGGGAGGRGDRGDSE